MLQGYLEVGRGASHWLRLLTFAPTRGVSVYAWPSSPSNSSGLRRSARDQALIDCAQRVKCLLSQDVKPRTARAELFGDADLGPRRHELEKIEDVAVAHAYAPDRSRFPHLDRVRAAVDVDVAPHGVHVPQPISPGLAPRQPQDAREDPVATGKALGHFRCPDLPRRAAPDEHRVDRLPRADFRANDVLTPRGAEAPLPLTRTVTGCRNDVALDFPPVLEECEALRRDRDLNSRHCAAPR